MNEIECCICLENINDNSKIINCDRCINIICTNCFEKIEKKFDCYFLLCYSCPTCNLEIKLNIDDYDNVKKYNLINYLKNLIILQNNNLNTLHIKNNILQSKIEYLLFYGNNSYKILKTFYLLDKMFIVSLIGILYLIF